MKWWIKFGCFITGWNSKILATCSEASYKALKKYTSSMLILIILWGFIGYCFADRYVHAPIMGCVISAIVAIIIIIQIERQIILTVGRNVKVQRMRFLIAIIMAILGSSILDQIIFGSDIDQAKIEMRDKKAEALIKDRQKNLQEEMDLITADINKLDSINQKLNNEIKLHPTITIQDKSVSTGNAIGKDGKAVSINGKTVSTTHAENPLSSQVRTNQKELDRLRIQFDNKSEKKATIESITRNEIKNLPTGLLEELNALVSILSKSVQALVFWALLFLFLLFLELFVLMSKAGDGKCDYDMVIEHQLEVRRRSLQKVLDNEIKEK